MPGTQEPPRRVQDRGDRGRPDRRQSLVPGRRGVADADPALREHTGGEAKVMGARDEFVERHARAILDLPQDVKALGELLDDDEIAPEGRANCCRRAGRPAPGRRPRPRHLGPAGRWSTT
ncbi:MAG: hypothetical protein MZV63_06055 [Marinilabiliales bacterium]|nr:hypothetical protein [Marinilabiliales bacterium]